MSTLPDGWRTCRHVTGDYDYYAADVAAAGRPGDDGLGAVATVYGDSTHQEIEVVANDALTPDEARALAVRLIEAAEAIDAAAREATS